MSSWRHRDIGTGTCPSRIYVMLKAELIAFEVICLPTLFRWLHASTMHPPCVNGLHSSPLLTNVRSCDCVIGAVGTQDKLLQQQTIPTPAEVVASSGSQEGGGGAFLRLAPATTDLTDNA